MCLRFRISPVGLGLAAISLLASPSYAEHTRHHHKAVAVQADTSVHHHHRGDQTASEPVRRHHHDDVDVASNPSSHHHKHHADQDETQDSGHTERLARQEHREHIERLHNLSHEDLVALKRHDRKLYSDEEAEQAHEERLAHRLKREAQVEAAEPHHHHRKSDDEQAAEPVTDHHLSRHLARLLAEHNERLAEHNANLAAVAQAHHEAAVRDEARHEARLHARQAWIAQRILDHNAHIAKIQAVRTERVAAERAHWVALHGDGNSGRSIQYWETEAANVPVKVITVDLNDPNVKVSAELSRWGVGSSEPFGRMIDRANPNVAVTGTFFSLDNLKPVGDIVIDVSLVHFGGMGTALCITPDNKAHMVTVTWGRHHDWSPYDFVCACGPRLLSAGNIVLDPHAERFRDRDMLAPNSRIAVGITPTNKLVIVMTHEPIYLGRLAKVMKDLGTSEAMNLDAGTSTGLFYNGTTLAWPGRRLTNMIVVYGKKEQYERNLDQLLPENYKKPDASAAKSQVSLLKKPDAAAPKSQVSLLLH